MKNKQETTQKWVGEMKTNPNAQTCSSEGSLRGNTQTHLPWGTAKNKNKKQLFKGNLDYIIRKSIY